MRDFGDLVVWQKSHQLTLALYHATEGFPKPEVFGLSSQIRRAGASVPIGLRQMGRWRYGTLHRVQLARWRT